MGPHSEREAAQGRAKGVAEVKTTSYRLYVTLGASQARKRLKGHGFGVKRMARAYQALYTTVLQAASGGKSPEISRSGFDYIEYHSER